MTADPRTLPAINDDLRDNPSPKVVQAREELRRAEEAQVAAVAAMTSAMVEQAGLQVGDILTTAEGKRAKVLGIMPSMEGLNLYAFILRKDGTVGSMRVPVWDRPWRTAVITHAEESAQ